MNIPSITKVLSSLVALGIVAGCASESRDDAAATEEDLTTAPMLGSFFLQSRILDEEFAADGAVTELAIATDAAGNCTFQALQAKGGCNFDDELCSTSRVMDGADGETAYAKHTNVLAGACTSAPGKLTLKTAAGDLTFKVKASTYKSKAGFVLASTKQINKAGKEAFFQRIESSPEPAFSRSFSGGASPGLTKSVDPNDPSLSPAVRAGLKKLIDELTFDENDLSSSVDEVWVFYASPFDKRPVGYGVSSSRSGDHCGGYTALGVDANGERLKTEMGDGDC